MDKHKIKTFFDNCASWWDEDMVRNEEVIHKILNHAHIQKGINILDVACGTGVLFPDYLKREVSNIHAIDLSSEMVKLAKEKFPNIEVICGDVENTEFDKQFDVVMVYNAFPHFPNPKRLIEHLSSLIKDEGYLSIAHGMSREALLKHHERAKEVSIELLEINELEDLLKPYFEIETMISDHEMYQIVGKKRSLNLETSF